MLTLPKLYIVENSIELLNIPLAYCLHNMFVIYTSRLCQSFNRIIRFNKQITLIHVITQRQRKACDGIIRDRFNPFGCSDRQ